MGNQGAILTSTKLAGNFGGFPSTEKMKQLAGRGVAVKLR
jgi:hypothetical protein